MPHQHVSQGRATVQGVIQRERGAARVPEDHVDATLDQRIEQKLRAVAQVGHGGSLGRQEEGGGHEDTIGEPGAQWLRFFGM